MWLPRRKAVEENPVDPEEAAIIMEIARQREPKLVKAEASRPKLPSPSYCYYMALKALEQEGSCSRRMTDGH
jgi:hypothetical protein